MDEMGSEDHSDHIGSEVDGPVLTDDDEFHDASNITPMHQGIPGTSDSHSTLPTDLEQQAIVPGRLSTKQRIMNAVHHLIPIKQTYERINNGLTTGRMQSNAPGRFIGQGTDGVFRNLMAKPESDSMIQEQETNPPTYEEANEDNAPEYWESSVISPMYEDEVFVEGLPVGNIANFIWNGLVTLAFQFVGFVLCYLLHTSHAAKHGSRAGLGITFTLLGYSMIPLISGHADKLPDRIIVDDANDYNINKSTKIEGILHTYKPNDFQQDSTADDLIISDSSNTPYLAYGLVAFGLFLIFKAIMDFYRVKVMERVILAPQRQQQQINSTTEMTENTDLDNT